MRCCWPPVPLLSGRDDANPTEDGRIDLWQRVFSEHIHGPADLLFGWGLGLSSNTINILYGAEHFQGQFDSDSLYLFLLNGYGLIGLLAYVFFSMDNDKDVCPPQQGIGGDVHLRCRADIQHVGVFSTKRDADVSLGNGIRHRIPVEFDPIAGSSDSIGFVLPAPILITKL